MYQGSHFPNFESLGVPKKIRRAITHHTDTSDRRTDDTAWSHSEGFLRNLHKKCLLEIYQGSHVPNFQALGIPIKIWRDLTYIHQTSDTASFHSEGFLRNLHKKWQTITHRQQTDNRHTDGGDDNTWNAKFAFQVKRLKMSFFAFFIKLKKRRFWSKMINNHENISILGSFMSICNQNNFSLEIGWFRAIFELSTVKLSRCLYIKQWKSKNPR